MAATRSKTSDAKRGNLEEDETLIPLKLVKELLNQQQSTMKSFLGAYMDSINSRIDNIIKDVQSVKYSLEFTQAQVDELLQTEPEAEELKSEIKELEDKVDNLENRSSRNNLCFEGIAESVGENWQQTENKVKELISTYMPFSVLAITETWIKENDANELNFDGYNFINNPRTSKAGGGVALYVDQRFTYKILTEFNVSDVNVLESLFVEITIPRMKNIIIGVIYRPPSEYTLEFLEKLNELLSGVTKGNKYCYITGDFNLDLLKHESHPITAQFLEALFSYGFLPMTTKPTRITAHSATLIDNIFTNNATVSSKNGLTVSDISDHLPIFSIVTAGRSSRLKSKNYITVRDMSEKRTEEFKTKLENTDWEFDKESGDPNASYDVFIEKFTGLLDSCFPFKIVRGKALNSFKKPWLTKDLLKSINKKNKLYKQYLRNRRSDAQFLKYKKYKNKLTYLLRIAKKRYHETQIDKNKDNIKLTWKILNSLINRTKKKSLSYPQLHNNGQDITNPEEIANKFCQYFTSIGPNLASKIPPASKTQNF